LRYPTFKESRRRSLTRSVIWRVLGVAVLAIVTYAYTGDWVTTSLVTVAHHVIAVLGYYVHERLWLWISWLKGSRRKSFARVFTYEVIFGNLVLGAVSYVFTGSLQQMTLITLTYIGNKYWMYYAYDYVWSKIKWQTV